MHVYPQRQRERAVAASVRKFELEDAPDITIKYYKATCQQNKILKLFHRTHPSNRN